MEIMKRKLFLILCLFFFITGCGEEDTKPIEEVKEVKEEEEYQPTQISENVTDLIMTNGNPDADIVWIYEQGGPVGDLYEADLDAFPNHSNYLKVYVHQVLTYNNELYNAELTVEHGEQETDVNSEILHKVIQHFKDQGKTVIVIGHSYGAFVVTDYLVNKGSDLADKYVIMAGRLDAEQIFYEGLINKQFYYYPDYVTPTLHPSTQPTNNKHRTELFLAGIIGKSRYTQELSEVDLSKVIYAFSNDDGALGRLTTSEKDFLTSKNVQIVEIAAGGHSAMFEAPNNQTIYDLMIK